VTVAASAAMLEAMPEGPPDDARATGTSFASCSFLMDLFTKIQVLLRSVLGSAVAYAKDSFYSISVATGEPPRRPFEDPDAPSWLPWVVDVAIIFCILAVAMFVLAFATMPRDCEGSEDKESTHAEGTVEHGEFAKSGAKVFRVILMAVLPAVSGAMLNVKHMLIPALLCGI